MGTTGNDGTTLGPSPLLAGKTELHDEKGASVIVFDTYMDSTVPADTAVVVVNGSGSSRRWFGSTDHKFGISFDFTTTVPTKPGPGCKGCFHVAIVLAGPVRFPKPWIRIVLTDFHHTLIALACLGFPLNHIDQ